MARNVSPVWYSGPGFLLGHGGRRRLGLAFVAAEDQVHQQADHHAEHHRAHGPRQPDVRTQHPRGQDDRQGVDRRPGVEEGRGRPDARAHAVDAGEQRQHRAGAHRQHGARHRRDAVGDDLAARRRPRYFITEAWLTKTQIAPAMKKAGTRHSSTCSRAYQRVRARASCTAPSKRADADRQVIQGDEDDDARRPGSWRHVSRSSRLPPVAPAGRCR